MTRRFATILPALLLLLACNEGTDPPPATGTLDVQWQVPALLSAPPLVVDSIIVIRTRNGGIFAYERETGNAMWGKLGIAFNTTIPLAVSGDVVIMASDIVRGIDARNGTVVWLRADPAGIDGALPPVVEDNVVYLSELGAATALDATTGQVLWRTDINGVVFPPALSESLVIYHRRDFLTVFQGMQGGELVALDRTTGEEQWRVELSGPESFEAVTPGMRVYGDRLIVPTYAGRLVAFAIEDGTPIWDIPDAAGPNRFATTPVAFGGHAVFAHGDGVIEARSLTDGSVVWSMTSKPFQADSPPQPCGAYLCVTSGALRLVGPAGAIAWDSYSQAPIGFNSSATSAGDGILFAGAAAAFGDYRLIALRPPVSVGDP